jgi:acetyl-CoA carboxylase carboxyl transferase subunit alpha
MPTYPNKQFLDFEQPIKVLYEEIEKLKSTAEKSKIDMSDSIKNYMMLLM